MSSTINASTASGGGIVTSADASGILQLQTGGITALTIDASQNTTLVGTTTATNLAYTGTLTGGTGILNIGSGQVYKDASGNVGIGTSSPAQKLQNSSTANAHIYTATGNTGTGGYGGGYKFLSYDYTNNGTLEAEIGYYYGGSSIKAYIGFSTKGDSTQALTERMRIDSSGKVGIGYTIPTNTLHVAGSGNTQIRVSTPTNNFYFDMGRDSADGMFQINGNQGSGYKWLNNGTEAMRIDSTGNLYVSAGQLRTNRANAAGVTTSGLVLQIDGGTQAQIVTPSSGAMAMYTGGTERMRISSTGIVTMSAYGVGTATFSAAGVISSVSDETWKIKDGAPLNPDEMLQKLEPGYWYYNDEKAPIFGTDRQLGFYAQNVNAAIGPEAAPPPEAEKPWGYYDRSVLAVTVLSLQKALATIEALTARLTALEAK